MSHNYDNWERLVVAVLLREELREIALRHSREPSTITDDISFLPSFNDISFRSSTSSFPDHHQALVDINGDYSQLPVDHSDLMINHTDWKALLPPGKDEVVWTSASLSFSLEKKTGKNCFAVGARGLVIPEKHHKLVPYTQSRFLEVAEVKYTSIHIQGRIEVQRLSPNTMYGAFLVFTSTKVSDDTDESDIEDLFSDVSYDSDLELSLGTFTYVHNESHKDSVFERVLESSVVNISFSRDDFVDDAEKEGRGKDFLQGMERSKLNVDDRGDEWKEVEIGNFYVDGKKSGQLEVQLKSMEGIPEHSRLKSHAYIKGIEFRPTLVKSHLFGDLRWQTRKEKRRNIFII